GEISLVEDQWALHSINLKSSKLGIGIGIKQMYAPFSGVTWLPVSNKFHITGNIWGVKFYYDYLASINYSVVVINKELNTEITLVDAKKDEVRAKEVEELNFKVKTVPEDTKVAKNTKKELTAEDFKRQLKEYEKEELKQQKENDVLLSYAYRIDSLAYKRPKEYWEKVRSVPLTALEHKGYYQVDSLAGNLEKDSVNKMKISPSDFLIGKYYRIDKNNRVILRGLLRETGFNTVEGLFSDFQVGHIYRKLINYDTPNGDRKAYFLRSNLYLKYSLARNKLLSYANVEYEFRDKSSSFNWLIQGGQRTVQLNREEPIPHILNSFYTLVLENNLIKIYQTSELKTSIRNRFSGKVTIAGSFGWESRLPLENQTNYTIINWPDLEYTSNNPLNTSLIDTSFPKHNHTSASMELELRPWLKYRMINGRKYPIRRTSPVVRLKTHWAIPDIFGGTTDYMKLKSSFSYTVDPGVFAELTVFAAYESFIYKNQLYFPDFIHFSGNQTVFSKGTDFRQLQYYNYSQNKYAIYIMTNVQFKRNILIAAIPTFARRGIRDYTFFNFLHTPEVSSYLELGYGLNYVFKFLKFEGVASFIDQKFNSVGIRIGLAPEIEF
ncbi:MAG: DUF5686 family protein, partial [Cyclobacteriaceae bacterium]|nr:DUF5686 family protein [Cyclobacteriaceae bacterium]